MTLALTLALTLSLLQLGIVIGAALVLAFDAAALIYLWWKDR